MPPALTLTPVQYPYNVPANLPMGILASIGPALFGSAQPRRPMSVITTVGLTAFTRICKVLGHGIHGNLTV